MAEQENQTFIYIIGGDNKITYVSSSWNVFARENGAPELYEENVKGRPLLDFVSGKEVKHLYEIILEKIRNTKQSIEISFRCDSPKVRRYMDMKISYLNQEIIEFETCILREEICPEIELLDVNAKRGKDFIVICSWCKNVKTPGGWMEVEQAINEMQLFNQPEYPMITHGICDNCSLRIRMDYEKLK